MIGGRGRLSACGRERLLSPAPSQRVVLSHESRWFFRTRSTRFVIDATSMVNGFVAQAVEDVPDLRMAEQPAGRSES